jgi:dihydrofolate synthase/folylpolyglutamate synthase
VRYAIAIHELFALQARGMRMGIERMRAGLAYRGLDGASLPPMIQIAGTNGKGSVSAMLASVLSAAGYRTGLFTSPHLHRFTERIQIDGKPLATREAARRIGDLLAAFGKPDAPFVSFFELSTLMAAEVFRDHRCDVAVMEVGLGGREDATNALPAALTIITRIAFDHEHMLGRTLTEIAYAKAGIIKPGVPLIVGSRAREALKVIRATVREQKAPARYIGRDFESRLVRADRGESTADGARRVRPAPGARVAFRVGSRRIGPVRLGLPGAHQHDNAACAVAALVELRKLGFRISDRAILAGLQKVRWPARLERVPGRPPSLLDAAHNPDGCVALAEFLHVQPERPRVLVFGVMQDKDYPSMLRSLAPEVDAVFYARPRLPRAEHPRVLKKALEGEVTRNVKEALRKARRRAGPRGLVVVAGSIFLVAEARARLLRVPTDPLIRM